MTRFVIVPMPGSFQDWPKSAPGVWVGLLSFVRWRDGKPQANSCYPSLAALEERSGYSKRTIRSALAFLRDKGLVSWYYDKGSRRTYYTFPITDETPCPFLSPPLP